MSRPVSAWYLRLETDKVRPWDPVRCYGGDHFSDGHTVTTDDELPDLSGVPVLWETSTDEQGRLHIAINAVVAPEAAPVWFVALAGGAKPDEPATHSLVAFDTDHLPPGTVVDGPEFFIMPIHSEEQVGAVQWEPASGIVRQIFVQPHRRRQDIAAKLLYAASAFHQAHRWPGILRSDGRRTELGQKFAVAFRHPNRVAPWTEQAPPMDRDGGRA